MNQPTENQSTEKHPSPVRRALKEARSIMLVAVVVAVSYNLFASTGVPWIAGTPRLDTASDADIFKDAGSLSPVAEDTTLEQGDSPDVDTTTVGTDTAGQAAEIIAAAQKRAADSAARVAAAQKRAADSAAKVAARNDNATSGDVNVEELAGDYPKEINTRQAKRLYDMGTALWVDARRADEYAEGHIPNAINIYAHEFGPNIPKLLNYDMENRLVVVYCGGGLCDLSHETANQMVKLGFKKVFVYTGGTEEWNAKKYPFTK